MLERVCNALQAVPTTAAHQLLPPDAQQGLVTKIQRHKVPPLPSCYSAEWKEVLEL